MVWERCPGQTGCQSHGQEAEHGEMLSCVVRLWGGGGRLWSWENFYLSKNRVLFLILFLCSINVCT